MVFTQVTFENLSTETTNILIALLSDAGFDGLEETTDHLKAYIPKEQYSEQALQELVASLQLRYTTYELASTNWNAVWESNFQPVVVEDFCAIRADFHDAVQHVIHDIVITPKMSFGTGHHATTFMMIRQMKEINFVGRSVLDFGTGTGVLAILAGKLGAARIVALDNDDWSIANATENFTRNQSANIELRKSDTAGTAETFDIILANITRNVILDNFSLFASQLADEGVLLLSGLLRKDEASVLNKAAEYGMQPEARMQQENWISLRLLQ